VDHQGRRESIPAVDQQNDQLAGAGICPVMGAGVTRVSGASYLEVKRTDDLQASAVQLLAYFSCELLTVKWLR
jgi:hypothetical protein